MCKIAIHNGKCSLPYPPTEYSILGLSSITFSGGKLE
jgi:hypothetical protein